MVSTKYMSALVAAAMVSLAAADSSSSIVSIPTPTATIPAPAFTDVGCFSTAVPLENHGEYLFQSQGNCQMICLLLKKPVMGLSDGTNCYCGDLIPPKDSQIDNSTCDTPCSGIDTQFCGGASKLWISLTGSTKNRIENFEPSSSSAVATKTAVPQTTDSAPTVAVTVTDAPSQHANKSSGPNKAGIAAGVVVGVVVLVAIIAGVILFLRHKRRREVEEEYRRQAAVNSFVAGGKVHTSNSSMTDSRLDPEFMARRASNGSIADNEDYSRRILKVTNA